MKSTQIRVKKGPEAEIQRAFKLFLLERDWFAKDTHGNAIQSGFPDMYADHAMYGVRWIEFKNPESYKFTPAQISIFPKINAGVWIVTACNQFEYDKLFRPANWYFYLNIWRTSK